MEQGRTIGELAETFGVHRKTVRRVASRVGVTGSLVQRRYGSIRVFGEAEVERLHVYFRAHAPEPEEAPVVEEGEERVEERQVERGEGRLALPPAGQVGEFLDLLADLRDQLARAGAREERAVEEARQLREVLAAVAGRLPAPSTSPAAPRIRWRACVEVAALGVVVFLAGAMVAAVARVLQVNGVPW